jgi:DNA mismatch repair protein MutS
VEHLHETIGCRALFATHYHELTALGAKLANLSCHTMRVKEWQGDIVFLHEVGPGAADRSYGIHVAKLAGLPAAVVTRAEQVLSALEQGEQGSKLTDLADDLPLFAAPLPVPSQPVEPSPADTLLEGLNPDEMTPRDALEYLYELKRALKVRS